MAPSPSYVPMVVLIVVVLVGATAGGAYLYYHNQVPAASPTRLVHLGDNVTVDYIGIFGSGPEQGKVFDTSEFAVAKDAIGYPKSLEYHARGTSASNYTTLDVHVGGSTPSSGYSLGGHSFIQVVTGFWQGLVGVAPNQTRAVIVPPNLGYGPVNPSCVTTKPLTYTEPILQTYSGIAFSKQYPGIVAATGSTFNDPHLGWPVLILSANASFVTVENLPPLGWSASPAGWPVDVTNVTSTPNGTGRITLENQLFPSQSGLLVGKDYLGNGPCTTQSSGTFIVTQVDLLAGTYTENFNAEVQGQTLIFLVTVIDVFPGP